MLAGAMPPRPRTLAPFGTRDRTRCPLGRREPPTSRPVPGPRRPDERLERAVGRALQPWCSRRPASQCGAGSCSFGLGYREEVDAGSHAAGRTDREVGLVLVDDGPAEDVAPEQRHRFGVDGVDTQDSKMTGHPSIVADPFEPLEAADHLKAQRSRGPVVDGHGAPQAVPLAGTPQVGGGACARVFRKTRPANAR